MVYQDTVQLGTQTTLIQIKPYKPAICFIDTQTDYVKELQLEIEEMLQLGKLVKDLHYPATFTFKETNFVILTKDSAITLFKQIQQLIQNIVFYLAC